MADVKPMSTTLPFLKNKYWVLRHGKSIPNDKGIIISSLENGVREEYGLANEGFGQAQLAGELFYKELKENNIDLDAVRIFYSPFSRTTDTAKMVSEVLNLSFDGPQCKVMNEIRERFFGPTFELFSHDKYPEIWALDEIDPFKPPPDGESVANVLSRLTSALISIEKEFQRCAILIVSHGDPLQILQTAFDAINQINSSESMDLAATTREITVHPILSQHRNFALLTGELRRLI